MKRNKNVSILLRCIHLVPSHWSCVSTLKENLLTFASLMAGQKMTARDLEVKWAFKLLDCLDFLRRGGHVDNKLVLDFFVNMHKKFGGKYCLGNQGLLNQLLHAEKMSKRRKAQCEEIYGVSENDVVSRAKASIEDQSVVHLEEQLDVSKLADISQGGGNSMYFHLGEASPEIQCKDLEPSLVKAVADKEEVDLVNPVQPALSDEDHIIKEEHFSEGKLGDKYRNEFEAPSQDQHHVSKTLLNENKAVVGDISSHDLTSVGCKLPINEYDQSPPKSTTTNYVVEEVVNQVGSK